MSKLVLDKETKYWMLCAERFKYNSVASPSINFVIKEVVLGLETKHTMIGAFNAKGKSLFRAFAHIQTPSVKDWYNEKIRLTTEKFHHDFQLNSVWSESSTRYGFFATKELAEEYLLKSGILYEVVLSAEKTLEKNRKRYFTYLKTASKIFALQEELQKRHAK